MVSSPVALLKDQTGATAIEYGLLVALIAVAFLVGLSLLGTETGAMWQNLQLAVNESTSNI